MSEQRPTYEADPGSLSSEQIDLLQCLVRQVAKHGFGQVIITIEDGRARFISPAPSYDLNRRFTIWDSMEQKP